MRFCKHGIKKKLQRYRGLVPVGTHLRPERTRHAPVHPILGVVQDPPYGRAGVDEIQVESRKPLRGGVYHKISSICGSIPPLLASKPQRGPEVAQGHRSVVSLVPQVELPASLPRREVGKARTGIILYTDVRASNVVPKSEDHRQSVFDDTASPALLDGA